MKVFCSYIQDCVEPSIRSGLPTDTEPASSLNLQSHWVHMARSVTCSGYSVITASCAVFLNRSYRRSANCSAVSKWVNIFFNKQVCTYSAWLDLCPRIMLWPIHQSSSMSFSAILLLESLLNRNKEILTPQCYDSPVSSSDAVACAWYYHIVSNLYRVFKPRSTRLAPPAARHLTLCI